MLQIKATDDLILEVWPGEGEGDRTLIRLRSLSQEQDGESPPGMVIIHPAEVRHLVAALVEAACAAVG